MTYDLARRLATSGSAQRLRNLRPEVRERFHTADERLGELAVGAV